MPFNSIQSICIKNGVAVVVDVAVVDVVVVDQQCFVRAVYVNGEYFGVITVFHCQPSLCLLFSSQCNGKS